MCCNFYNLVFLFCTTTMLFCYHFFNIACTTYDCPALPTAKLTDHLTAIKYLHLNLIFINNIFIGDITMSIFKVVAHDRAMKKLVTAAKFDELLLNKEKVKLNLTGESFKVPNIFIYLFSLHV